MYINDTQFTCSLDDILSELQSQLHINQIPLINKIVDSGSDIMITCPYHKGGQESRPSAGIRKSDGLFHCFTCGETHSLAEVITYCFGKYDDIFGTFGWNWLKKNFLSIDVESRDDIELDFSRGLKHSSITYIDESELDSYRYIHPYMYKRGLTDEIIEMFDIGYDSNSNCITFPVRDVEGKCLFVARRSVKSKYFNYPCGVEKPIYGIYELYKLEKFPDEILICESMLDALSAWTFGRYAIALNGTGTSFQFSQIRNLPCRKIILATDMDNAGLNARIKIKNNLKNKIITEYLWDVNVAKDINDMTYEYFSNLEEIFR